jgi:hypothetical protein
MTHRNQRCSPCLTHVSLHLRQAFLLAVCRGDGLRDADADAFLVELRKEAFGTGTGAAMHQRVDELLGSVPGYAQRLWTSVSTLRSPAAPPRELCGLINRAIRLDDPALLQPLMVLLPLPYPVSSWSV